MVSPAICSVLLKLSLQTLAELHSHAIYHLTYGKLQEIDFLPYIISYISSVYFSTIIEISLGNFDLI